MQLINVAINLILIWSGNCNIYSNAAANHSLTLANISQKQNFIDPSILGVNRLFVLPFENNM